MATGVMLQFSSLLRSCARSRSLHSLLNRLKPTPSAPFRILGIETSCDDTGVAVLEENGRVLGEALHSQLSVHQKTGGIVPNVAGQLHQDNLERVTSKALEVSGCGFGDVAAIAVTTGPGLAPSLNAGLTFAKNLAIRENKPVMPVHHMEAHALTPRLQENIPFPYLVLLISGGHCILATVHRPGSFHRLGETGDDSPGEAFDKVARWLCLDTHPDVGHLSGGAAIEVLAQRGDPTRYELPVVMLRRLCCNFSFAGLKTATLKLIQSISEETGWDGEGPLPGCEDMAASFQEAVCRHLLTRSHRALAFCKLEGIQIKHMVISGGVASNKYIRSQFESLTSSFDTSLHCPPPALCTDNGVMIAWAAIEHLKAAAADDDQHCTDQREKTKLVYYGREDMEELDFRPRWPLGDDWSERVKEMNIKIKTKSKESSLTFNFCISRR